jgi:hypothetical protein
MGSVPRHGSGAAPSVLLVVLVRLDSTVGARGEASSIRKSLVQDSPCDIHGGANSLDSCLRQPKNDAAKIIEQMASLRVDDAILRGFARLLDEIKGNAGALSLSGLAETAGIMGTMLRRGGGLQFKVRGLRELLGSLKSNYDAALRAATTPERAEEPDAPA